MAEGERKLVAVVAVTSAVYGAEGVRSAAPVAETIRPPGDAVVAGTGGASSQRVPLRQAAEEKLSAATPTISSFVGEVKRTTPRRQTAVTQLSVPAAVEIVEVTTSVADAVPLLSAKKTAFRWFSQPSSLIWRAAGEHSTARSVDPGAAPVTVTVTFWPLRRRPVGANLTLGLLVTGVTAAPAGFVVPIKAMATAMTAAMTPLRDIVMAYAEQAR